MNNARARLGGWAAAIATGLLVAWPAFAAEPASKGTLSVILENDLFCHTDQHYTNGLQASWVPNNKPTPAWALRAAHLIPWFPKDGEVRHGYAFGQTMFTPSDITVAEPPPGEPPYAGWLYGAIGMNVWTGRRSDEFTMTVGVVGPASFAEESQKFVHKVTGSEKPRGWDTQLGNEPGIILAYQRSWRGQAVDAPVGLKLDLTPHVGGELGNVYTHANAGLMLRYGSRLPRDDSPLRIQPGVAGSGFYAAGGDFGWYLFASLDGRAVARNIFLDGNTFRDSRSVDKKPFLGEFQLGFALTWRAARLGYAQVVRTREYEGQPKNEDFGALTLSVPL